ncbi:hypothetical protein GCM10011374_39640 [Kocuria dechangensis]|uniref:CsbD-like domain-containing protein n=1 Tax=Kocuria dechangensis TaxID=1176249 RepID=A0A917M1D1_9MICC|nr:hypothetical protein GCM10011374_39640 [Kocuria dechangensis]
MGPARSLTVVSGLPWRHLPIRSRGVPVGLADKINNAADTAAGAAKKKVGEATNNRDLQAEGQAQESTGHLKQAGEKLKDAAKDVTEGLK